MMFTFFSALSFKMLIEDKVNYIITRIHINVKKSILFNDLHAK